NTGTAVKPADAKTVLVHVKGAAEARDHRVEVPAKDRALMRRIAEPLGLGHQKEAYFELSRRWADHFRKYAQHAGETGDLSVISLKDWIDLPQPRGLESHIANLVVASFAEMDDRIWVRGGVPIDTPELTKIGSGGDALRTQPLPGETDWDTARNRFEVIFGGKPPTLRRGAPVQLFARQIVEAATAYRDSAARLVEQLEKHADFLQLDDSVPNERLALARRSLELLTVLTSGGSGSAGAKKTVETLAGFDLGEVSADRLATSIKSADKVINALTHAAWHNLEQAKPPGPEGATLLDSLRSTARADQRSGDLVEALRAADSKVTALTRKRLEEAERQARLEKQRAVQHGEQPPASVTPPAAGSRDTVPTDRADDVDLGTPTSNPPLDGTTPTPRATSGIYTAPVIESLAKLRAELAQLDPGVTVEITWKVVP